MAPKSNTKTAAVKLVYKVDFSKPAGDGEHTPFPLSPLLVLSLSLASLTSDMTDPILLVHLSVSLLS